MFYIDCYVKVAIKKHRTLHNVKASSMLCWISAPNNI